MNWLLLRGAVPQDRDPKEIMFDKLEDNDDVWTQLAVALMSPGDKLKIWYYDPSEKYPRQVQYSPDIEEIWYYGDWKKAKKWPKGYGYEPDIIFARGGFENYLPVFKAFPKAYKIYYGAGKRYLPSPIPEWI